MVYGITKFINGEKLKKYSRLKIIPEQQLLYIPSSIYWWNYPMEG